MELFRLLKMLAESLQNFSDLRNYLRSVNGIIPFQEIAPVRGAELFP